MKNRNSEGYHDPTACLAIEKASRSRREPLKSVHLTYLLDEARGFRETAAALHR